MPLIQHILFPYDFSDQGARVAPFVRGIACRSNAIVTLLSVVPPIWAPPMGVPIPEPIDVPEAEQRLKAQLEAALPAELEGVRLQRMAASGEASDRIAEFAVNNGVDLIMMPTHGLGVFRSVLLGSVTAKVLHDVHCPVWTAVHAEEQHAKTVPRVVVCAIDDSPEAITVLRWTIQFSDETGAALRLIHVVPPASDWLSLPSERRLQEELRDEARVRMKTILEQAACDLPLRIGAGPIAATLAEEARQEDADLIVIGRGAAHERLGRLRTHVYQIIQEAPCPVLSV